MEKPTRKNWLLQLISTIISYVKNSALGSILSTNTAASLAGEDLDPDALADVAERAGLTGHDFTDLHGAFSAAQGRVNALAATVTAEPKPETDGLFRVDPDKLTPLQTNGNSGGKGKGGKRQTNDYIEK